jgi:trk system potassium uptake protein TrkA
MKAIVLGCGRVGSMLARQLTENGWEVTVVDSDPNSFVNLGDNFSGKQVAGRISDEEVLRSAGMSSTDLVVALTSDDISNLMAAQIARQKFGREMVLARVRDPVKAGAYRDFGLKTVCSTNIELEMILNEIGIKPKKFKGSF